MSSARALALCTTLACACNANRTAIRDAASEDAVGDAAATNDSDSGRCDPMLRFTGEYLDWDSGASFCSIAGATFRAPGTQAMSITDAAGRFDLCVSDEAVTLVDITPPVDPSPCTPLVEVYRLPAIAVASKAVIAAGGSWSGRAFGSMRHTVDPTRAQVLVHMDGAPRNVSISARYEMTQARNNDTWGFGTSGSDVFFIDVDPGAGSTMLSADSAIGTGPIPLVAGKLTNVSIVAR